MIQQQRNRATCCWLPICALLLFLLLLLLRVQLAGEQSHFAEWIEKDLAPWQGGITKVGAGQAAGQEAGGMPGASSRGLCRCERRAACKLPACLPACLSACLGEQDLLEDAANMYDVCDGDMLRFQVINGSLWVHHITDRWVQERAAGEWVGGRTGGRAGSWAVEPVGSCRCSLTSGWVVGWVGRDGRVSNTSRVWPCQTAAHQKPCPAPAAAAGGGAGATGGTPRCWAPATWPPRAASPTHCWQSWTRCASSPARWVGAV